MDFTRDQLAKRLTEYQQAAEEHRQLALLNQGAAEAVEEMIRDIDEATAKAAKKLRKKKIEVVNES